MSTESDNELCRPLEVEDCDTSIEGETTFITIDRDNILETSMEEISSIQAEKLSKTLEVQFNNEVFYLVDFYKYSVHLLIEELCSYTSKAKYKASAHCVQ